jgi:hypothetical protein
VKPSVQHVGCLPLETVYRPQAPMLCCQAGEYLYTFPTEHLPELYAAVGRYIGSMTVLKHPDPSFPKENA